MKNKIQIRNIKLLQNSATSVCKKSVNKLILWPLLPHAHNVAYNCDAVELF